MRRLHLLSRHAILALALIAWMLLQPTFGAAEQVTVRSGDTNGGPGSIDPNVRMLVGPTAGPFPAPFAAADFAAASSGPSAVVISAHPAWSVQILSADPLAKWVNNTGVATPANTVLYAVPFQISHPLQSAVLQLTYALDDYLGHNPSTPGGAGLDRPGLYVNGVAVPGTNGIGDFHAEYTFTAPIGPLLAVGQNFLYFYALNYNDAAGIIFSATITTQEVPNATETTSWGSVKKLFR